MYKPVLRVNLEVSHVPSLTRGYGFNSRATKMKGRAQQIICGFDFVSSINLRFMVFFRQHLNSWCLKCGHFCVDREHSEVCTT